MSSWSWTERQDYRRFLTVEGKLGGRVVYVCAHMLADGTTMAK